MFILTFIGTIVAALLAFCGLINLVCFFASVMQGTPLPLYINGFLHAVAPLAAGCVLQLLIELLKRVELLLTEAEKPAPLKRPNPAAKAGVDPEEGKKTASSIEEERNNTPLFFVVRDTPQGPVADTSAPDPESTAKPASETPEQPNGARFFKVD